MYHAISRKRSTNIGMSSKHHDAARDDYFIIYYPATINDDHHPPTRVLLPHRSADAIAPHVHRPPILLLLVLPINVNGVDFVAMHGCRKLQQPAIARRARVYFRVDVLEGMETFVCIDADLSVR